MATTAKYVLGLWMIGVIALAYRLAAGGAGFSGARSRADHRAAPSQRGGGDGGRFRCRVLGWRYLARGS
jgi:hypothetical protein